MKVITTIIMTFLLLESIWLGAVQAKEPSLAKVVFYVG